MSTSRLKYQVQERANEISYLEFPVRQMNPEQLEVEIASMLNVQLHEEGFKIPFVPFDDFEKAKRLRRVFLYGPRGTGKSRVASELIRDSIENYDRIIFINPRKGSNCPVYSSKENQERYDGVDDTNDKKNAKSYQSDSQITSLQQLVESIGSGDLVVWDNFPEGMTHRDRNSAFESLESICSSRAGGIYVTLQPLYLELYKDIAITIPEIQPQEIQYSPRTIKEVLRNYGQQIRLFAPIYDKCISNYLNRLSKLIWYKEPVPMAVLNFYKAVGNYFPQINEGEIETEQIITNIINKWRPSAEYYEHQFSILSNLEERHNEVEFLFTLRLCYDIGFTRTEETVCYVQESVFKSQPPRDPSGKLSSWVFLSGPYYSLHDAVKDAIKFPTDVKLKVVGWLTKNIGNVIHQKDPNSSYLLGVFIGSNIGYVTETIADVLTGYAISGSEIRRQYQKGIGEGIAASFVLLDDILQDSILDVVISNTEPEFATSFGENLGQTYNNLDVDLQREVLEYCKSRTYFSHGMGAGISRIFFELDEETRDLVLQVTRENILFSEGFGIGIGSDFSKLDDKTQQEIFSLAKRDSEFARGLGDGLGRSFRFMNKEFQGKLLSKWIRIDSQLARGVGIGIGRNIKNLDSETRGYVFDLSRIDSEFSRGLGFGIGYVLSYVQDDGTYRKDMFEYSKSNPAFGMGLGMGICYSLKYMGYQEEKILFDFADENSEFGHGFGIGLGWMSPEFSISRTDTYNKTIEEAKSKILLAHGFGIGLGYMYSRLGDELRKKVDSIARHNVMMTLGLGWGIGYSYLYDSGTQSYAFSKKENDVAFANGLGSGLGYVFPHLSHEFQENLLETEIKKNSNVAKGLGFTLGWIFNHVDEQFKSKILATARNNPSLSCGLGEGIGYIFDYLDHEEKYTIFKLASTNNDFSLGLATGLGSMYNYHKDEFNRFILIPVLRSSVFFARGFGIGIGQTIKNYSQTQTEKFFALAKENCHFSHGLGYGIGKVFSYLDEGFEEKLNLEMQGGVDSYFSRGLGEGIGQSLLYVDDAKQQRNFDLIPKNKGFSTGMGKAIGSYVEYLPEELFEKIRLVSSIYPEFARGLGEGIGQNLVYYENYLRDLILLVSKNNNFQSQNRTHTLFKESEYKTSLLRGLGVGIGQVLGYFERSNVVKLCQRLSEFNELFNFGLGAGIASNIDVLDANLTQTIHSMVSDDNFWRGFGGRIGLHFKFMNRAIKKTLLDAMNMGESKKLEKQQHNSAASCQGKDNLAIFRNGQDQPPVKLECLIPNGNSSNEFWRGFGEGLGYHFGFFEQQFQQSVMLDLIQKEKHIDNSTMNKNDILSPAAQEEFMDGFGFGLGRSFGQTDETEQLYVLKQIADSQYMAQGFGKGAAFSFPILSVSMKKMLFDLAENNSHLAKCFFDVIKKRSWDYIDENTRKKIKEAEERQPK